MKGNSLKESWRRLRSDLKPMSFPKKIEHLWTYYKGYLLPVGIFAAIIAVVIVGINNRNKELVLSGQVVNVTLSENGFDYLSSVYATEMRIDGRKQILRLSYSSFSGVNGPSGLDAEYTSAMTPLALAEAGMLDYLLLDEAALNYYINQGLFLDMRSVLTDQEIDHWAENLIYAQQGEEEMFPAAVNISDLPFIRDNVETDACVYFAFVISSPRIRACRDLWEWILDWQS